MTLRLDTSAKFYAAFFIVCLLIVGFSREDAPDFSTRGRSTDAQPVGGSSLETAVKYVGSEMSRELALINAISAQLTPDEIKCHMLASASANASVSLHINVPAAAFSPVANCASQGFDINHALAGTAHYGGSPFQAPGRSALNLGSGDHIWQDSYRLTMFQDEH